PTFFINGRMFTGARPLDAFKTAVDAAKAEAAEVSVRCSAAPGPPLYAAITARGRTDAPPPVAAAPPPPAAPAADAVYDVPVGKSPVRGPKDALVTLVMFTDFQCPFCRKAMDVIAEIRTSYGDDVRLVFKHMPLTFHKDARLAAIASVAAGRMGKFWEYHDQLWAAAGTSLGRDDLLRYAETLHLDAARFTAALDDPAVAFYVDDDVALATRLGVTGTPTFFVNGKKLVGALPYDAFKTAVDEALARAADLIKTGVARASVYEVIRKTASVH
ncbi:MAG TPA: DsbA family protein, partial [Myxococcota bacterium]|nr:DsbA family protein [Myxococcota bacterium]